MKEFFLILFFSKTVLLTTAPIDLFGEKILVPDESLNAITQGASIQIDVSDYIAHSNLTGGGLVENQKQLNELIPQGSMKAILFGTDGSQKQLDHIGFSWSPNDTRVVLTSTSGIPTDREFNKVIITSCVNLKSVRVYWKNYVF